MAMGNMINHVTIIQVRANHCLINLKDPIIMYALLTFSLICSTNESFASRRRPKCLCLSCLCTCKLLKVDVIQSCFFTEKQLHGLFVRVRIKTHFPVLRPVWYT